MASHRFRQFISELRRAALGTTKTETETTKKKKIRLTP